MRSSQDSIFINQFVAVVFLCKYFQDALKVSWAKTEFQQSIKQYYPATPVVPNSGFPIVKRAVGESGGSPKYFKKWHFFV